MPRPQVCLALEPGPAAADRLAAALDATDIASVIISAGGSNGAPDVQPLLAMAQKAGAAALLHDDARLARTLKADGVLISAGPVAVTRYEEARSIVGKGAIVGVTCGPTRHEAMEVGEAGADFLAFGPVDASSEARARQAEHVAWWVEIFELPCVALQADDAQLARPLVEAGADFLCVTVQNGETAEALVKRLDSVARTLRAEVTS